MTRVSNHFQFVNAKTDVHMTVLNAVMADFSYANHAHEEFAVGITLKGIQEFVCKGSRFKSAPGNIILFNPGDVHNGNPGNREVLKYIMLYLDPESLYRMMGSVAQWECTEFVFPEPHFHDRVLQSLIMEMYGLVTGTGHSALAYEHCLYKIATQLTRKMGIFCPETWKKNKDTLFIEVTEYIRDNITEDISIEDLSAIAHTSKYHFIRLFRSQFGLTPHQFIINCRINRVREALVAGKKSSRIAQDYGFFDVSHLNRHFKRIFGVTPKQYQTQLLT